MKQFIAVSFLCASALAQGGSVFTGGSVFNGGNVLATQGTVGTPVTITAPSCPLPTATANTLLSATFVAANGTGPYSYAVTSGALPDNVTLATSTGVISGTPTDSSTTVYNWQITATDALGAMSAPYSCSVTVNPPPAGPVSVTNSSPLPAGQLTVAYSLQFTATGGTPGYTWGGAACSGSLPNGLTLSNGGLLSGTPTVQATFTFGVQATDTLSSSSSCTSFSLTVNAAPSCSTSPGPPTYPCTRTDLANSAPFVPVPNVGNLTGFNTIVTPTGFNGNRIVRVADTQAITPNHFTSWVADCGGSSDENLWNANDTLFVIQDEGCNTYPVAFNPATLQAAKIYPSLFPTSGFHWGENTFFKFGSNTILHSANTSTPVIHTYDFTDWVSGPKTTPPTPTLDIDFTAAGSGGQRNCLPSGFTSLSTSIGGSTASDNVAMAYSTTSGQGSSGMVYIVAYVRGKGCIMWNTSTGAVTADPGFSGGSGLTCNSAGCAGSVTTTDRFTVHKVVVHQNDNWLEVTATTCLSSSCNSGFPAEYFWNINGTTVGWIAQGGDVGGHITGGYTTLTNTPGTNHVLQTVIRTVGVNESPFCFTPSTYCFLIPLAKFPTFPSVGLGITDEHKSWNDADVSDSWPFLMSIYDHPSGSPANNWAQVSLPSGVTQLVRFGIDTKRGDTCVADRLSGVWCNGGGGGYTQRNTGLPTQSGNVLAFEMTYDWFHDQWVVGLSNGSNTSAFLTFWIMAGSTEATGGASWTQMPTPYSIGGASQFSVPTYSGMILDGSGNIIDSSAGGGPATHCAFYSTNGGTTTNTITCPANGSQSAPGNMHSLQWNPITNQVLMGSEAAGLYVASGSSATPCSVPEGVPGPRVGNMESITYDNSGNVVFSSQGGVWKQSTTGACPWTFTNTYVNTGSFDGKGIGRDYNGNIYWGHKADLTHLPCSVEQSTDGGVTFSDFCSGLPTGQEAWQFRWNPLTWQECVLMFPGSTNVGTLWCTVPSNGTLSPFAWQNELIAMSPSGSGTVWRFAPLFNTTLSQNFQTQVANAIISQTGKFALFNSDWMGTLGSETGQVPCLLLNLAGNCRGDVFAIELK